MVVVVPGAKSSACDRQVAWTSPVLCHWKASANFQESSGPSVDCECLIWESLSWLNLKKAPFLVGQSICIAYLWFRAGVLHHVDTARIVDHQDVLWKPENRLKESNIQAFQNHQTSSNYGLPWKLRNKHKIITLNLLFQLAFQNRTSKSNRSRSGSAMLCHPRMAFYALMGFVLIKLPPSDCGKCRQVSGLHPMAVVGPDMLLLL